jgi:SAM-dependent methyltransferase
MGRLQEVVTPLHKRTQRDYLGRMVDEKVHCMRIAREYGADYWDGSRRYGYGGYRYDGRWSVVAQRLVDLYRLPPDAKILDVGCGKGFLMFEFTRLLPRCQVTGFDISEHALANGKEEVRSRMFHHRAQDPYPFADKEFDLVVSLTTLHNLRVFDLKSALREVERVGKSKYVVVESYRYELELFNLQCWALTCDAFFTPEEWTWLFKEFGYTGDHEFIYFEGVSMPVAAPAPQTRKSA